jgi:hypothetical protein
MTETHVAIQPPDAPAGEGRLAWSAFALLVGGVLVGTGLALHLRGGVADVAFVERVEEAPERWLAGHLAMTVGALLLASGLGAVRRLAVGRGRGTTAVGAGIAAVGATCTALGDFAHGALAYVLIGHLDAADSLAVQEDFYSQPALAATTMLGNLLPLGILVLGIGLLRSGAVPWPAAALLAVSPVVAQIGYVATALPMAPMVMPLVVGMAFVARAVWLAPRVR